jgi:hypothetical protein
MRSRAKIEKKGLATKRRKGAIVCIPLFLHHRVATNFSHGAQFLRCCSFSLMSLCSDGSYHLNPFVLPLDVQVLIFEYCASKDTLLSWRAVNQAGRQSSRSLPARWCATPLLSDADLETLAGLFNGIVLLDIARVRGGFQWCHSIALCAKLRSLSLPVLPEDQLGVILEQPMSHLVELRFGDTVVNCGRHFHHLLASRTQLQRLSVHRDMITPVLSSLTNLQYLRLVGHSMHVSLSELVRLRHIVLEGDQPASLRDCTPRDLSSLTQLEQLESSMPASFATFVDITSALLNLSVLSMPLLRLPVLYESAPAHRTISRLTGLRVLDVPFHLTHGTGEHNALLPFVPLVRLENLDLSMEEDLDLSALRTLTHIKRLSVQHPKLASCLKVIFSFPNLCDLELRSASLRGSGWHLLSRLNSLQSFSLFANPNEQLPNSITLVSKLSRLSSLTLGGRMSVLPVLHSSSLTALEILSSVLQVGSFSALPQLRRLGLLPSADGSSACDYPELQGIPTTLEELELASVPSQRVFEAVLSCTQLRRLNLIGYFDDNQMQSLVGHLSRLRHLRLRSLPPSLLSENTILRFSSLRHLSSLEIAGASSDVNHEHVLTKLILSLPCAQIDLALPQDGFLAPGTLAAAMAAGLGAGQGQPAAGGGGGPGPPGGAAAEEAPPLQPPPAP